jgi:hypothetical protein
MKLNKKINKKKIQNKIYIAIKRRMTKFDTKNK